METRGQEDGVWDGGDEGEGEGEGAGVPPAAIHRSATANDMHAETVRRQYHECLRNHAAAAGGHVVDGCCEFMPVSTEDPLACAACGCHRSFHRRDPSPGRAYLPLLAASARAPLSLLPLPSSKHPHPHPHQRLPFAYGPAPSGGTGTTTESSSEDLRGPAPAPRKRSRTTFTREQKEQMLAFAERVGWRMQRQDEATVEQFCAQAGVRRQALKVWMHNNKQSSAGRRQQQQQQQEKLHELRQEQQQ